LPVTVVIRFPVFLPDVTQGLFEIPGGVFAIGSLESEGVNDDFASPRRPGMRQLGDFATMSLG